MSKANLGLLENPNTASDVPDPFHNKGRNNSRRVRPCRQPPSRDRVKSQHRRGPSLDSRRNKFSNPEGSFDPRTKPKDTNACASDRAFAGSERRKTMSTTIEHPRTPDLPTSSPGMRGQAHVNPTRLDTDRATTAREHPRVRCLLPHRRSYTHRRLMHRLELPHHRATSAARLHRVVSLFSAANSSLPPSSLRCY